MPIRIPSFLENEINQQRLEVRLTKVDPKTGKSLEGDTNVLQISGANIAECNLQLEPYGFDGEVKLISQSYSFNAFETLRGFICKGPLKIDICYQHKRNKNEKAYQLLLTGFLTEQDPIKMNFGTVTSYYEKTKQYVIGIPQLALSFRFCDPMKFWLSQQGLHHLFQGKTYSDIFTQLVEPFTSKSIFGLTVDSKLKALSENKRRLVVALSSLEHPNSVYDYMIEIARLYSAQLAFDFSACVSEVEMQAEIKEPAFTWPEKMPESNYKVCSLLNSQEGVKASDLSSSDLIWLSAIQHQNASHAQAQYMVQNVNQSLIKNSPEQNKETLCTQYARTFYGVDADITKYNNSVLSPTLNEASPTEVVSCSFSGFPVFAEKVSPLSVMNFKLPFWKGIEPKSIGIFANKKEAAVIPSISIHLQNTNQDAQASFSEIRTGLIKGYRNAWHSICYEVKLIDKTEYRQSLPVVREMTPYSFVQGTVVSSTSDEKSSDKSPQYLYNTQKVKESDLSTGYSLDPAIKDQLMYTVKIPEFKSSDGKDVFVEVPVAVFAQKGQQHMPLKNGTQVRLRCYLEHIELDAILKTNLADPVSQENQVEASYFGANQEMSQIAQTDKTGKSQSFTTALKIDGDQTFTYSLAFDASTSSTTLKAVSSSKE